MKSNSKRVCLIVLDSVGIGALPDAAQFGDSGAHTLGNINAARPLSLPNMYKMGLGNIENSLLPPIEHPTAAYCRLQEVTKAKDTTSGHWEMAGLPMELPFQTFPNGFPLDFLSKLESAIRRPTLGNKAASGTEIIRELGEEHMKIGAPIVYTSADSVLQIAAHEDVIPVSELYHICETAFEMARRDLNIGRVIARPFIGLPRHFTRTEHRKDFAALPPRDTILDILSRHKIPVHAIGKIEDIFSNRGITSRNHTTNNEAGIKATIQALNEWEQGLIFTNLVDFDMLYGHRNDVEGYAKALEYFDSHLPNILAQLRENDILMITADHGCDPTMPGTDHTREYIPCLIYGNRIKPLNLGTRSTFADIAATIIDFWGLGSISCGTSVLPSILE